MGYLVVRKKSRSQVNVICTRREQILKERIGNGSDARPIAEIAADLEFSKKSFRRRLPLSNLNSMGMR